MAIARLRHRALGLLLALFAVGAPAAIAAQAAQMPVVGFLSVASADSFAHLVAAFREGLAEAGFVEGQNVAIEYRWADGQYAKLPALAAELVGLPVDMIVASGGDRPALAAKAATVTIPIVFAGSDAPVALGLVESLARPGGNITGISMFTSELELKKLDLLLELVPAAQTIGLLVNPNNPAAAKDVADIEAAVGAMGKTLHVVRAQSAPEIDRAFVEFAGKGLDGLVVGHDPFFNSQRQQIVPLVAALAVPAVYEHREFVLAGGLISYGNVIQDNYRMAGRYAGRILQGANPADLPVQQAAHFELVVNLQAAAALGLELPSSILVRADAVFE